jgi:hypothetical protein
VFACACVFTCAAARAQMVEWICYEARGASMVCLLAMLAPQGGTAAEERLRVATTLFLLSLSSRDVRAEFDTDRGLGTVMEWLL